MTDEERKARAESSGRGGKKAARRMTKAQRVERARKAGLASGKAKRKKARDAKRLAKIVSDACREIQRDLNAALAGKEVKCLCCFDAEGWCPEHGLRTD